MRSIRNGPRCGRDQSLLKHLKAKCKDQLIIEAAREFLDADRAQREELGKKNTVLNVWFEARSDLQFFLRSGLKDTADEARSRTARQAEARNHAAQLLAEQQSIPSKDTIADILREREMLQKEIAELQAEYAGMGHEIDRLGREMVRMQQSLAHLLETDAQVEGGRQDRERILRHSERVRGS